MAVMILKWCLEHTHFKMEFSEKMYLKLMETMFNRYYPKNWIVSVITWITDSNFRKQKRITKFLEEQINNPTDRLRKLGIEFRQYSDLNKRIIEILRWVKNRIVYMSDEANFKKVEYWATADETLTRGYDDCDGMNGLIYVLARLSGIPRFLIYCVLGDTNAGFHFYCLYLNTDTGFVHPIDSTYNIDLNYMKKRKQYLINYNGYRGINYVFNDKFSFKQRR